MPVEKINPVGLTRPVGYHHVTVSTGTRTICVAGQTAHNVDGEVVGLGDLATQIEQTYANVVTALEGAGATFADVAKLTMYVVGWSVDQLPALSDGIGRAAAHEPWERAEVAQLKRRLGPRLRDEPGAREEPVVRLAGEERPVDEDARGRATLALGRVHGSTPAAVARGATSKPRRAYARHRTRK